jgi:hypothetical protein
MTDHDLNLEGAYALKTPQDTKRLYAAWADTYDDYFSDAQGYLIPREVVRMIHHSAKTALSGDFDGSTEHFSL